jgi:Icc-related predicted phosphoesterase
MHGRRLNNFPSAGKDGVLLAEIIPSLSPNGMSSGFSPAETFGKLLLALEPVMMPSLAHGVVSSLASAGFLSKALAWRQGRTLHTSMHTRMTSTSKEEHLELKPLHRVWAISDIHTDVHKNLRAVEEIDSIAYREDALIVAGDIADDPEVVRHTLRGLRSKFKSVFFVAGNHDLWIRGAQVGMDSLKKIQLLDKICEEEGVDTRPRYFRISPARGVWIVPLVSWHSQDFDSEPDIDSRWQGIRSVEQLCSDYKFCKWPPTLNHSDDSIASKLDSMNDERIQERDAKEQEQLRKLFDGVRECGDVVISFSHFLPRIELLPEKRYLRRPSLAKLVGSPPLGQRLQQLKPDLHIFGHTHFGWDQELDGTRYVSPPLGNPRERERRLATIAIGDFPGWSRAQKPIEPLLIWDIAHGFPEKYQAAWSAFYEKYPREPEQVSILPAYLADRCQWDEEKHGPKSKFIGWEGKTHPWGFGPVWTRH